MYMTGASLVPDPAMGEADPTKLSPPFDVSSTFSNPLAQFPITILADVLSSIPIPDATNSPVEPTESFKTIISDIT